MKNDGVRSCLKELQSFLQSKVDVDQIHRALMFLPCFVHVLCKTRCLQVDRVRILVSFVHRIDKQKNTVCLLLKFCPPGINPELMMECKIDCTSDMTNVLEETVRNSDICPVMKDQ